MTEQPEALRVATKLDEDFSLDHVTTSVPYAARLLREQHAEIEHLRQTAMNRVSVELHMASIAELQKEIERLRAECDRLRELAALYINEICRFDKERMS